MDTAIGRIPLARRYLALDGYRFLAASLVALHHFNTDFQIGLERFSSGVAGLGVMVDFFFVLSGFVIAVGYMGRMENRRDYGRFLRARFARLYPLHLATLGATLVLIGAGTALGMKPNHPEVFALSALPANALSLHAWGLTEHLSFNGGSWSISAEWFVYLLAPLAFLAARRLSWLANVALLALVVLGIEAGRSAFGLRPWWDASYDFGMLRAAPTFFCGVLIAVWIERIPLRLAPRWGLVHAVFLLSLALLHLQAPREAVILTLALLVALAAHAERAGKPTWLAGAAMKRAGDASYAFYLTHGLVAIVPIFVARRYGLVGGASGAAIALACMAATLVVSIWLHRRFERPMQRLLLGQQDLGRITLLRGASAR